MNAVPCAALYIANSDCETGMCQVFFQRTARAKRSFLGKAGCVVRSNLSRLGGLRGKTLTAGPTHATLTEGRVPEERKP